MKKDLSFSHYLDVLKEFQHLWPLTCNHFHCVLTPEHSVRMWYQEHKCVPHVVFSCLLLKNKTSCHESIYPLTPIKKKKKTYIQKPFLMLRLIYIHAQRQRALCST